MDNSAHFPDTPQWPSSEAPAAAGSVIGHNRPPIDEMARQDFNEAIDAKEGFRSRVEELVAAAGRAVCTTEEEAGRCGELIRQIRAAEKFTEETHRDVKAPYLAASRAVDDAKNTLIAPLVDAKQSTQKKLNTFIAEQEQARLEQQRREREAEEVRQREEAERLRAEGVAEADVAEIVTTTAPVQAERTMVRGDYGAAVSGRKEWTFQIEDYETALLEVAGNAKVREAVEKAIAGLVRSGTREIKGVRIFEQTKANVR